jgi:hypothetical protein
VCQVLDIIILCPIIYLDCFWCIKYQYINIYMKNRKRKGEKKKNKEFSVSWAHGIRPSRARARPRGRSTQLGPPVGYGVMGVGPRARGRGRLMVSSGRTVGRGRTGRGREKPTVDEVPWRFFVVVPVPGDRGGG